MNKLATLTNLMITAEIDRKRDKRIAARKKGNRLFR
jgi:hypothetical protein